MSKYCIYLVTNLINGKVYVGKSVNPAGRWNDHKKIASGGKEKYPTEFFAVHAALHKHGIGNFKFEIVDELDSEDEAYRAETQCILLSCSNLKKFGYNCNLGGEGGIIPNEETRQKLIAAQNRPHIKKLKSNMMKRRHLDNPGYLAQFNKGNQYTKGHKLSDEHKQKLSEHFMGRPISNETKKKMSESQSGDKHSQAKLTKEDVLTLRSEFQKITSGKKQFMEDMGIKYGVGPKTIENVIYRLSWISI